MKRAKKSTTKRQPKRAARRAVIDERLWLVVGPSRVVIRNNLRYTLDDARSYAIELAQQCQARFVVVPVRITSIPDTGSPS